MRCKTCDYSLWNLKTRQCPECGGAFLPSEFEFVPNSVCFCCRHCEQSYYGTGEKGHLVPQEFTCVSCGRRIAMDEMVLRPAHGVEESQTEAGRMPWLERKQRGIVKAWLATIGMALIRPGKLTEATPRESSPRQAWWFACMTNIFIQLAWFVPAVLLMMLIPMFGRGVPSMFAMADAAGAMGIWALIKLAVFLVGMTLWALSAHALLLLTGGTNYTLGRTFQAIGYSAGANVITAIPCFGGFMGVIWWIVSATFMLKAGHRVNGGRATLATLTFPLLLLALLIGGYVMLMMSMTTRFTQARAAAQTSIAMVETRAMGQAIINYSSANRGQGPQHAVQLFTAGGAAALDFIVNGSATDESAIPVADTTLSRMQYLPVNRQRLAAQAAADALPANVIAHRLGDFVFTHHGIDLGNADPGLWIVIWSEDPDGGTINRRLIATVGFADGSAQTLPQSFATALSSQNDLRAKYGLPPLPDPTTVTHTAPAVAGGSESAVGEHSQ